MTGNTLKDPKEAAHSSTVLPTLILELFEKIIATEPLNEESWTSHCNGALAIAKLRGFERFRDPSDIQMLERLTQHSIISCVASCSMPPTDLKALQKYVEEHQDPRYPVLRLLKTDSTIY